MRGTTRGSHVTSCLGQAASVPSGMSKIHQMLRYAAAKSRCELCHTTRFGVADDPVTIHGKEYAVVTCQRCGRMGLHDIAVLERASRGAPVETA